MPEDKHGLGNLFRAWSFFHAAASLSIFLSPPSHSSTPLLNTSWGILSFKYLTSFKTVSFLYPVNSTLNIPPLCN